MRPISFLSLVIFSACADGGAVVQPAPDSALEPVVDVPDVDVPDVDVPPDACGCDECSCDVDPSEPVFAQLEVNAVIGVTASLDAAWDPFEERWFAAPVRLLSREVVARVPASSASCDLRCDSLSSSVAEVSCDADDVTCSTDAYAHAHAACLAECEVGSELVGTGTLNGDGEVDLDLGGAVVLQ